MGGRNSNPLREGGELLSQYSVTSKNAEHFLTFLAHKKSQKEYVLREVTFAEQREFTLSSERMKNRKQIKSQHLTLLERIEERTEDNMCSHYFKIYTLWQHPSKSLSEEINERALQRKPFENKELWSILACSIMGLSTLQQHDIKHQCLTSKSILINEGNVKISDPLSTGLQTNFQALFHNRTLKSIYLSPQQCEAIESQKPIFNKNSFKNDVFTLAMILLECGLLERQDQCYLDDCSKLNWAKIEANLSRFSHLYQEDLRQMLALMLTKDIRNRPDWLDLSKFVIQNQNTSSATNTNQVSSNNILNQYSTITNQTQKRDHFITRTVKSLMPHKKQKSRGPKGVSTQKKIKEPERYSQQQIGNSHVPSKHVENVVVREASPVREGYPYPGYHASLPPVQPSYQTQAVDFQSIPTPTYNQDISQRIAAAYSAPPQAPSSSYFPSLQLNPYPIESKPQFQFQSKQVPPAVPFRIHPSSPGTFSDYIRPAHSINYELHKTSSPQKSDTMTFPFDPKLTKTPQIADTSSLDIQPQYVEEHFKVGSRYEGYKLNGMRHGTGKFYYQDGGFYDGDWKHNKMEGQGILYYQSNNKAYEGAWVNDQFHGQGILYNDSPRVFDDYLDYNSFDDIDDIWEYYQGSFNEDEKDGHGKLQFCNGEYFEGTFKKDMVEGEGTFYCMDGRQVHGIWRQNQLITLLN